MTNTNEAFGDKSWGTADSKLRPTAKFPKICTQRIGENEYLGWSPKEVSIDYLKSLNEQDRMSFERRQRQLHPFIEFVRGRGIIIAIFPNPLRDRRDGF